MLRKTAVEYIKQNADFYSDFVPGNVDINRYLSDMSLTTTYGDSLTLQALAREFNCQFLVFNAQGSQYHRIVSNKNAFNTDVPLVTLGFYPEEQGEHYVSDEIENRNLMRILQSMEPTKLTYI